MSDALPIALTMGEPAGIGGEITLKAWARREKSALPSFFIVDDVERLKSLSKRLGMAVPVTEISEAAECDGVFSSALPVLHRPLSSLVTPGIVSPEHAGDVIASIDTATGMAVNGAARAVVTNPIHKKALYDAGFSFPGHTEYLGHLCQSLDPGVGVQDPLMLLSIPDLRVVPVTGHASLRQAIGELTVDRIVCKAAALYAVLQKDFAIHRPRIGVAALNPHAGEDGALGQEEIEIIKPAIQALASQGISCSGPHPADTLFHTAARSEYDAALCMYHDQALIPLKTLDFERGVNSTHDLPIVRTSPNHGTALTIAGTGRASAASLEASIHLAAFISERRMAARESAA